MNKEFLKEVIADTLEKIEDTLGVKALEYVREDNAMHNFDIGARMTNQIREKVLYGFALKHHISIADMRNDIENNLLPKKEVIEEKFGDAINYLILEKASMLHRLESEK